MSSAKTASVNKDAAPVLAAPEVKIPNDHNDLTDEQIAGLRAKAEADAIAKSKPGVISYHYCPITGVKVVTHTNLAPVRFKVGIPEMTPGVNKGEIRGCAPDQALRHVTKGLAAWVLPDPVMKSDVA
jgi:hypothetical protein